MVDEKKKNESHCIQEIIYRKHDKKGKIAIFKIVSLPIC